MCLDVTVQYTKLHSVASPVSRLWLGQIFFIKIKESLVVSTSRRDGATHCFRCYIPTFLYVCLFLLSRL